VSTPACRRCESPLEAEDLRCAICGLPTPVEHGAGGHVEQAKVLRCHGCGAAVAYDAAAQAPRCDFCGSVMEVETPQDPIEQAEHFLRFSVSSQDARAALEAWLGAQGFFRPGDLQRAAKIDALKPLWWVGWMFHADVLMSWAADSDADARRSRWAPHSGQANVSLRRVVVPASRGLTDEECMGLVSAYDISNAAAGPEGEHAGATVEQFTLQRSAARKVVARALQIAAARHAEPLILGNTHRNLKVACLPTRLSTGHYAFPAYVLAYRYRDTVYRAVVHGQDATRVLGKAPWSIARIAGVIAAVFAVVLAVYLVLVAAG
jgi:hypothetical protein